MARPAESGRSRAARPSPLTFRRFGPAINTDEVFGTHSRGATVLLAARSPQPQHHTTTGRSNRVGVSTLSGAVVKMGTSTDGNRQSGRSDIGPHVIFTH